MDNRYGKTLFAVTTYNQLEYTKLCVNSITNLDEVLFDLVIFDDYSTDGTIKWCEDNNITCFTKQEGKGLTDSWNEAYTMFKDNKEYEYLIIANNDIIVPKGALTELLSIASRWPFSVVVPLSAAYGAGHNARFQGIENVYQGVDTELVNNPNNFQFVQDHILNGKKQMKDGNNLFVLDPIRMKMFNGFFFLMTRKVIDYEYDDGTLFDSTKPLYKAEDEFNWAKLIPNNDFAAVCKTSFIYHFKGKSTDVFSVEHNTVDSFEQKRKEIDNA